jgi:hypothetical protein
MKYLIVIGLALAMSRMATAQVSQQPSKGIVKKQSSLHSKETADGQNKQQAAKEETSKAILAAIAKDQQERADNRNDEASRENESIKAEWWLVYVGIAQAVALILTLAAIWYQARETRVAAEATKDAATATQASAAAIEKQVGIMERQTKATEDAAIAAKESADAALLNAQAVVNAERPWLIIEIGQDESGMGTHLLRVWNRGETPAEMTEGQFGFSAQASTTFVPTESVMGPFVAPMQTLTMSGEFIRIDTMHPHNFLNEHRTGPNDLLYIYGKILYWDTFTDRSQKGAKPFVTQWCLTYEPARHTWYRTANGYSKNT